MGKVEALFATKLYRSQLGGRRGLNGELDAACRSIAGEDRAGQAWAKEHGYQGYTSYASLDDLGRRAPPFGELARRLDRHVLAFARNLDLDLGRRRLALDSLWINVLRGGGAHTGHIHPHSVISGTYYVAVPRAASAIRFEDPRLAMMMAAPPRKARAARDNRTFVTIAPKPGMLVLWESWLRHEVPASRAKALRISVSFNFRWGPGR